jgi:hypothetical protein
LKRDPFLVQRLDNAAEETSSKKNYFSYNTKLKNRVSEIWSAKIRKHIKKFGHLVNVAEALDWDGYICRCCNLKLKCSKTLKLCFLRNNIRQCMCRYIPRKVVTPTYLHS